MTSHLEQKISERRDAIQQHDRVIARIKQDLSEREQKRMIVAAELRAYEDALKHMPAPSKSRRSAKSKNGGLQRKLSDTWTFILRKIGERHPLASTHDEIMAVAEAGGYPVKRENLRSQMSQYKNRNIVERLRPGEYRLTKLGAKEVGITLNEEAPDVTSGASTNLGEAGSQEGPSKATPTGSTPVSSTHRPLLEGDNDEIPF